MSFADYESSRHKGVPVELYFFRYGTGVNSYFAYTDAEEPVPFQGIEYKPIPIMRSGLRASGSLDKSALDIDLPINSGIAELFRVYPPSQQIALTIRQGHLSDPDKEFLVAWTGRVLQCSRDGSEATLKCEPVSTSMRRSGLRRHYQLGCPHPLYGPDCRASKAAATSQHRIVNLESPTRLQMQDAWSGSIDPRKYLGGMVEWMTADGRESRTILRVINLTTLSLSGPATGLAGGDMVDVILGCNHQCVFKADGVIDPVQTDCLGLHSNIQNFGGQPWIPLSNPINTNPFS